MKKNGVKKLGALVLSGILAVSLVGCGAVGGAKSDDKEISIGVTPVPHQEIVKAAVVPALEKEGYKEKVVEFTFTGSFNSIYHLKRIYGRDFCKAGSNSCTVYITKSAFYIKFFV